ncbi:permease YjgP/YjgQ family protein [Desulfarculus baarsii DSM 2075]|uniref:Permease YjgP/YjgQ family protein n=1 Tax=Desulfarculus baarsii (strain ATCC 33931 / DSM 2075 / LMG 7858 / VKM B-1802 / 2st14) TaxID=644282 RepID=E1QG41_DESB2|nr:LPS export ABC transporter permease LptF [Desulfarculus baarsii]ADK84651.1 permease YjgP/YjgQ family protein [Desulfarculus baarsii DSM 2075]
MFRPRIIHRYLLREMIGPFFISLGVFTFMLLIAKIMELTDLVVSRGVGLDVVGRLLLYTLPYFFVFTIPMATLLGVLLAFLRMSGDMEVVALKAAGVSPYAFLPPVAVLAICAWLVTSALAFWGLPWGNHRFENLVFQVAKAQTDLALKERVFMDTFPGMVIYISRLPGQGQMTDLFIVDEREKGRHHTIVAKRGKIFPANNDRLILRLYDGTIHSVGQNLRSAQTAAFVTYDIAVDASTLSAAHQRTTKHEKEMYFGELLAEMDKLPADSMQHYLIEMEMHKKFSVPFACLVMALIGLPLGMHSRGGRSWGVAIALVVFLGYYLMLSAAWSFGKTGDYPPIVGMWAPNLLLGALAVELFRREVKEKPLAILDVLGGLPVIIQRLLGAKLADRGAER